MERITDIIDILESYLDNINVFMETATIEAQDKIIDMNIGQLYDSGQDSDGNALKPDYAPVTVQIKREKGQRTDHVTLRDTFAFQSSFWIQFYSDGFEIMASDRKTDRLKAKYGEKILGLQDGNVRHLLENFYQPRLVKSLKEYLNYA